jgi:hypothetical protein
LSILGDSTKRTYDPANVEHRNWWESTLQPLCSDLADDVNMKLVPRLNQDQVGWFDFSNVKALQSDSRILALGAILPLMVGAGKPITITEFRDELGLPGPRPDDPANEAKIAGWSTPWHTRWRSAHGGQRSGPWTDANRRTCGWSEASQCWWSRHEH